MILLKSVVGENIAINAGLFECNLSNMKLFNEEFDENNLFYSFV